MPAIHLSMSLSTALVGRGGSRTTVYTDKVGAENCTELTNH